jgi:HNH endonuclease
MQREFWQLGHLSDADLVEGTRRALALGRKLGAEVLAHLGEVEERRLHLHAACSSLFDYCVNRLGLSEDEACRRIDVARLARRFPVLFPMLADGSLSLSVAALLKPHLSQENHIQLLRGVRGLSVCKAREHLAAVFPQPDVASSVRKLPTRRAEAPTTASSPAQSLPLTIDAVPLAPRALVVQEDLSTPPMTSSVGADVPGDTRAVSRASFSPAHPARARIESIAAERYRIQFTASATLKSKLEQCRDLMRHSNPSADLAPIVERALDLLLGELKRERFGQARRPRALSKAKPPGAGIDRATKRATVARDGLRCSWVSDEGQRCPARAWLEFDHRQPRAKGGTSDAGNIRLLCRSHNRLAAELDYGRATIDNAIERRRDSP